MTAAATTSTTTAGILRARVQFVKFVNYCFGSGFIRYHDETLFGQDWAAIFKMELIKRETAVTLRFRFE